MIKDKVKEMRELSLKLALSLKDVTPAARVYADKILELNKIYITLFEHAIYLEAERNALKKEAEAARALLESFGTLHCMDDLVDDYKRAREFVEQKNYEYT